DAREPRLFLRFICFRRCRHAGFRLARHRSLFKAKMLAQHIVGIVQAVHVPLNLREVSSHLMMDGMELLYGLCVVRRRFSFRLATFTLWLHCYRSIFFCGSVTCHHSPLSIPINTRG